MGRSIVVFFQGAGQGAHMADQALASSLARALGTDFDVRYPSMPGEEDPDYQRWKPAIAQALHGAGDGVILVAHSAGAPMLLRYLAEQQAPRIAGLFLIAAPYLGSRGWHSEGWDMDALLGCARFVSQVVTSTPVVLYHSRDDDTVPFAHQSLYAEQWPWASVRQLDSRGHQLGNDLAEVAQDIVALAA